MRREIEFELRASKMLLLSRISEMIDEHYLAVKEDPEMLGPSKEKLKGYITDLVGYIWKRYRMCGLEV